MKAITLWQPWASLVAIGAKVFETRHWPIGYRGPIAVHAATRDPDKVLRDLAALRILDDEAVDAMREALNGIAFGELPRGQIVAVAELVGCYQIHRKSYSSAPIIFKQQNGHGVVTIDIPVRERLFGDYALGRYAWELAHVHALDAPVSVRGRQGIWEWREAS